MAAEPDRLEADLRDAARLVHHGITMLEAAQTNRDELIRKAHADRVPMRTIAEWAGVSHQRVAQIVQS